MLDLYCSENPILNERTDGCYGSCQRIYPLETMMKMTVRVGLLTATKKCFMESPKICKKITYDSRIGNAKRKKSRLRE